MAKFTTAEKGHASENTRGGMTLGEIGDIMGITRERVRQIEAKALMKLKAELDRRGITLEDLI